MRKSGQDFGGLLLKAGRLLREAGGLFLKKGWVLIEAAGRVSMFATEVDAGFFRVYVSGEIGIIESVRKFAAARTLAEAIAY